MAKNKLVIHWFRQDLRLADNPALSEAAKAGAVLPIYILDDNNSGEHAMGAASRWWLHHALASLNASLDGKLALYQGKPQEILPKLMDTYDVQAIYWNRCYEPWRIARDQQLKELLRVETHSFNGSLLWEPWNILKSDGTPYRVFTPFYKNGCLHAAAPRIPLGAPKLSLCPDNEHTTTLNALNLLPKAGWDKPLEPHWIIGEAGAEARLDEFLGNGLAHYKEGRNLPAKPYTSRLSPYLHFGQLSPNQAWYAAKLRGDTIHVDTFCSELGWREFSYSLLYHNPTLPKENIQKKFDDFPWTTDDTTLTAWQRGKTGVPIVDAGMRELWQTGYMHNRVRMIVGSFLVKNLLLHWHHGEAWFWDCLVDADLANNSASWQWIAGCGADAAPYFRIFNPVTQGQRFDANGEYTRHYVPELKNLPNKYLFNPWDAPEAILWQAGVVLGDTYPKPQVDIQSSRQRALAAFKSLRA